MNIFDLPKAHYHTAHLPVAADGFRWPHSYTNANTFPSPTVESQTVSHTQLIQFTLNPNRLP